MIRTITVALVCAFALSIAPANARPKQASHDSAGLSYCASDQTYRQACGQSENRIQSNAMTSGEGVIGRRPPGCPHRYCGCEASLYLFGVIKPQLNLAWNWVRYFPRTSPAPKMAAARRGHVMVLLSHVSGSDWLVHDGNSGGGLTRVHVRSIRGYVVVDPNGSKVASR